MNYIKVPWEQILRNILRVKIPFNRSSELHQKNSEDVLSAINFHGYFSAAVYIHYFAPFQKVVTVFLIGVQSLTTTVY